MNRRLPAYIRRLVKAYFEDGIPNAPGVFPVEVYHDDWCGHWQGGPCDCDAQVEIRDQDGRLVTTLGEQAPRGDA